MLYYSLSALQASCLSDVNAPRESPRMACSPFPAVLEAGKEMRGEGRASWTQGNQILIAFVQNNFS